MRTSILSLVAALASVVYSASIPGLPECASSCVSGFGSCNQLDVKCICSSKSLIADLACCVSKVCSAADQAATIVFANALCQGQGVSDLPQTATCASTAATASSTAPPASSANNTSNATVTTSTATGASATSPAAGNASTATATASATATATAGAMVTAAVEWQWLGSAGLGVIFAAIAAAL